MLRSDVYPPAWRIALAFVGAPTAAAIALAGVVPGFAGTSDHLDRVARTAVFYAVWGAYPTTLVFGVPAFLALRRRLRATPVSCILVGAAVAVAPWLVLALFVPSGDAKIAGFVAEIAAAGAVGGATFWLLASARRLSRVR